MGDAGSDKVSEKTRQAEIAEEAKVSRADAGRGPTPEEEEAAERADAPSEGTAEAYRDMTEKGARAEGEGRLP